MLLTEVNNINPDSFEKLKSLRSNDKRENIISSDLLNLVFNTPEGQTVKTVYQDTEFIIVARKIIKSLKLEEMSTRFYKDGNRIQNNLTLNENGLKNDDEIEIFQELTGGMGLNADQIRNMLESQDDKIPQETPDKLDNEAVKSIQEDKENKNEENFQNSLEFSEQPYDCEKNRIWFNSLKQLYLNGQFKLDSSNSIAEKLIFSLKADYLEAKEIIRFKNIHDIWKQHQVWDSIESGQNKDNLDQEILKHTQVEKDNKKQIKRINQDTSKLSNEQVYKSSPSKRQKLMGNFDLKSPSPLKKKCPVSKEDMKRMSVSVHLWAEREKGGVQFLKTKRLTDADFQEVLSFTGPQSDWRIMKEVTISQFRSMWRNIYGARNSYRGHRDTGYEDKQKRHDPSDTFCPFGHCKSGILSPMDMDMVRLTPDKKTFSIKEDQNMKTPNRQLFNEDLFTELDIFEINETKIQPIQETEETIQIQKNKLGIQPETSGPTPVHHPSTILLLVPHQFPPGLQFAPQTSKTLLMESEDLGSQTESLCSPLVRRWSVTGLAPVHHQSTTCLPLVRYWSATSLQTEKTLQMKNKEFGIKTRTPNQTVLNSEEILSSLIHDPNKNTALCNLSIENDELETIKPPPTEACDLPFCCKEDGCNKSYATLCGLKYHYSKVHFGIEIEKEERKCNICNKNVIFLYQHLRTVHSYTMKSPTCEICLKEISSNLKQHRKNCTKCLFCDYKNSKKNRLLSHIKNCQNKELTQMDRDNSHVAPLDLRSPLKKKLEEKSKEEHDDQSQDNEVCELDEKKSKDKTIEDTDNRLKVVKQRRRNNEGFDKIPTKEYEDLERGRFEFPFDMVSATDEEYYSEFDCDDTECDIIDRRKNKDMIETELRKIDSIENTTIEGDNKVVKRFIEFMNNGKVKVKAVGFAHIKEVSTVKMYATVLKNDILKACHKLYSPFHADWILDCSTIKDCKFEGEQRSDVLSRDPIYMTVQILDEVLKRYAESGGQRKIALAAMNKFLDFIEYFFVLKISSFGIQPLDKVQTYHKALRIAIKGTSKWKNAKDDEIEAHEKNKTIRDYETPHQDLNVLEKYKKYIKSEERITKISSLMSCSYDDENLPTSGVMTNLALTVMGEIVACTGCRPKVVRHLIMGAWVDKKPGFNPHNVSDEDSVIEEEDNGDKIFRRVNPNLPPRGKACQHQKKNKSAICDENCKDQCKPEGYNIYCNWDKTKGTKGSYYLHLPAFIKDLMDAYDIIRTKFFRDKISRFGLDENWLEDDNTPFFLNSACGPFEHLDLKKLSEALGVDVTAYSFRKIVATWGMSHESVAIRNAEGDVLQHVDQVAKDFYLQNKQLKPQMFIQTYTQEEELFPLNLTITMDKHKSQIEAKVLQKQNSRIKIKHEKLLLEKASKKKSKLENQPLGLRRQILESDCKQFSDIVEDVTKCNIENLLSNFKPIQWRDFVVRLVCSTQGEKGVTLRKLWTKMYQGDLMHGVRDLRRRAKENNWPIKKQTTGRRDRNSWIAFVLRNALFRRKERKQKLEIPH